MLVMIIFPMIIFPFIICLGDKRMKVKSFHKYRFVFSLKEIWLLGTCYDKGQSSARADSIDWLFDNISNF